MKARPISLVAALVLGVTALTLPRAGAEYVMHARVSFDEGGTMVKGLDDADWSYATVNTLVLPNDTLWADKGGMTELEMAGGSFLRMADGSKAELASLPPSATIRGWTGAFYVQRIARSTGDFVFETPSCTVQIEPDSQVRLDIIGEGATTVSVRWGRATVRASADGSAVLLLDGQRVYVDPGCLASAPMPFDRSGEDSFDTWNRERAHFLAVGPQTTPIPVTTKTEVIGVSDLAPYGEWVYVDRAYYWRPTVVVDYVPYRYGYWSYVPACGYVWVGHHPFSYVTSHYGRWTHHTNYGWLWSYSDVWGPAWVATVRYGSNFVWCPLDPWDRPVVFGNDYYMVGGTRFGLYGSSYCLAADLLLGTSPVYACSRTIVSHVPASEINIWNINVNAGHGYTDRGRPRARSIPFTTASPLEVRDYFPRRSIRGPVTYGEGARSAAVRVATLEKDEGRPRFTSPRASSQRVVRTSSMQTNRTARVRSVALAPPKNTRTVGGVEASRTSRTVATRAAGVPSGSPEGSRRVVSGPSTRTLTSSSSRRVTTEQTRVPESSSLRTTREPSQSRVVRQAPSRTETRQEDAGPSRSTALRSRVPSTSAPDTSSAPSRPRVVSTTPSSARMRTDKEVSISSAPAQTPVYSTPSRRVSTAPAESRVVRTAPSGLGQDRVRMSSPSTSRTPSAPAFQSNRVVAPPIVPSAPSPPSRAPSPPAINRPSPAMRAPSAPAPARSRSVGSSGTSRSVGRGRR